MKAWFPALILTDPGFPTGWEASGDVHLPDGSPLIDLGNSYVDVDPATPGVQFLPDVDLDGDPRFVDGDGDGEPTVDIGAFEYQGGD
jgi:hypothetical protein